MRIRCDPGLQVGWFPVGLQPRELSCTFVVKATFSLANGMSATLLPEGEGVSGDVALEGGRGGLVYASDFAPFKPRADLLLRAHAHSPGQNPVRYLPVSFRVGGLSKSLLVAGDRTWNSGMLGRSPGEPASFTTMPLTWERALGGPSDRDNPAGVGRQGAPMPNVEWPQRLLRSPGDRVEPAGFGPIAADWKPRSSLIGTYGGDYLATRWPWFPADLEWGHFNSAPRDQQLDGYLRGDEELQFTNLHRSHPELITRLPGVQVKCYATFRDGSFRGVLMHLDTMFADLECDKLVLVWRGFTRVQSLRMPDLEGVLATHEPLGSAFPDEHYRSIRDAAPPSELENAIAEAESAAALQAFDLAIARANAQGQDLERRVEAATIAAEAEALAQEQLILATGVDPRLLVLPKEPQDLATAGAMVDKALQEVRKERPDMVAPATTDRFLDAPAVEVAAEEAAAPRTQPPWTRQTVEEALASNADLTDAELTGLDLSNLDFGGRNLAGAKLSGANLASASLRGANLAEAVLAEALLESADLSGAVLDGADFTGAICKATLFRGCSVVRATMESLRSGGCDFSECHGEAPSFAGSDLQGCDFRGARMPKCDFSGCQMTRAVLARAELPGARFGGVSAAGIDGSGANLQGMHGGDACDLSGAILSSARLDGSILTDANLSGADLRYATMHRTLLTAASLAGADLSRADLAHSVLDDCDLHGARLLQTNLLYCSAERVRLDGADLRWANLYGAGLWQTSTEKADLRESNTKRTLLG